MNQIDSLAPKEVLIIVLTQIVLFAVLFVRQTRIGEMSKLEYAKESILYQLNQAEYIKQKFERINDLFTHLLENKIYVEKVSKLFVNDYRTVGVEEKKIYLEGIQERHKNILMKTSFYIEEDTKDLITEYLMSCSTLTSTANIWGNSLAIILKANGGGAFVHKYGKPVDIDSIKNRISGYSSAFDEQRTNAEEYFSRIETALKSQLESRS